MEDLLNFSTLITKSLQPVNSEDRYFEGYLTIEMKDKQGEITIVDELIKVLPVWMDRGAPISDTHSNRIIGKGINYAKTVYKADDGTEYPAIKITGKIYKNYELDNDIWQKIKSGEYKGLSFGGATRTNRTPVVMKDGTVAYALKELEHYEVAVCREPAVPLALITDYNPVAKAFADNSEERDGKLVIKCSKFGCYIDKKDDKDEEEEAKEVIEREHELKGEKPSKEEEKIHEKVIEEQKDEEEKKKAVDYINKPFGGYPNFDACVAANKDKDDPKAYCGSIQNAVEKADQIYKKRDIANTLSDELGAITQGKVPPQKVGTGKNQISQDEAEKNKSMMHKVMEFKAKTLKLKAALLSLD